MVQISLDKNSFKHVGVENYNTKFLILQKRSVHIKGKIFKNEVLNISDADLIYREFIKLPIEEKDQLKQKLFLENIKNDNREFQFKVKKLVFDIKTNPKAKKYLAEYLECIKQYRNQKRPSYMNYDEWQKIKTTKSDVLGKLKDTLRLQNPRNSKQNRLIKDKHNLRLNHLKIFIYKPVTDNHYQFENTKYKKLIDKKIKQYNVQSLNFNDIKPDSKIEKWLKDFKLKSDSETIKLNKIQLLNVSSLFLVEYLY